MGKLDNKTVLITGGTSGIGFACAKLFRSEGASIIITGRNSAKGLAAVRAIGFNCRFYKCDVTKESDIVVLKKQIMEDFGRIDVLFNNAGLLITNPLPEITEKEWLDVFATNTNSVMLMTKHFIDVLIENNGNILNNASIDGLQSCVRGRASYAYGSSKAATIQFTQICALNFTPLGVRVNCLCPGVTDTPFFTNRDFSRFISSIPMGRVARPEEIAKVALFIVSDDASYISGANIVADGGASLK